MGPGFGPWGLHTRCCTPRPLTSCWEDGKKPLLLPVPLPAGRRAPHGRAGKSGGRSLCRTLMWAPGLGAQALGRAGSDRSTDRFSPLPAPLPHPQVLLQPTQQPLPSAVSPAGKRKLSMLGPGSPSQRGWALLSPWGLPPHPPCFGSTHDLVTGVLGLHKQMVIRCAGNSEKLRLSCSDRTAVLSHPPASPPGAFRAHLVPTACAQCSLWRGLGVTCPPLGLARL